jgi:hypothetical protein
MTFCLQSVGRWEFPAVTDITEAYEERRLELLELIFSGFFVENNTMQSRKHASSDSYSIGPI